MKFEKGHESKLRKLIFNNCKAQLLKSRHTQEQITAEMHADILTDNIMEVINKKLKIHSTIEVTL